MQRVNNTANLELQHRDSFTPAATPPQSRSRSHSQSERRQRTELVLLIAAVYKRICGDVLQNGALEKSAACASCPLSSLFRHVLHL